MPAFNRQRSAPRPAGLSAALLLAVSLWVTAALAQPATSNPPGARADPLARALRGVPDSLPGYRRHVFTLPARPDEDKLEVELFSGKMTPTDNCSPPGLQGEFERHNLRGVSDTYWVFKSHGPTAQIAKGCSPEIKPGWTFAKVASPRLHYDSRERLVVFVPEAMALRYRVLTLGSIQPVPAR